MRAPIETNFKPGEVIYLAARVLRQRADLVETQLEDGQFVRILETHLIRPESKAIDAPEDHKAVMAAPENKARRRK